MLWNPRVRLHPVDLPPDVFFQIIESMKALGRSCGSAHLCGQLFLELFLAHLEQAAIGVIDDDEFLRIKQMVRNDQRPNRIVGGDAAGIANHVGVSGLQSQAAFEKDSRIHAGQHGHMPLRLDSEISQIKAAYKLFVSLQ